MEIDKKMLIGLHLGNGYCSQPGAWRFPLATPIEVAYASLFLATDDSSYHTAAEYKVDGGMTSK